MCYPPRTCITSFTQLYSGLKINLEDSERHCKWLENVMVSRRWQCSKNRSRHKYKLGSITMHCVNKASNTGRPASAGVCVKDIWLNWHFIFNNLWGRNKNVMNVEKAVMDINKEISNIPLSTKQILTSVSGCKPVVNISSVVVPLLYAQNQDHFSALLHRDWNVLCKSLAHASEKYKGFLQKKNLVGVHVSQCFQVSV